MQKRVERQESMVNDLAERERETKGGRCVKKGKQMRMSVVSGREE